MVDVGGTRLKRRVMNWFLVSLAIAFIGGAVVLTLKPELFFLGSTRQLAQVAITPHEATMMGAQWRLVTQWQGAGAHKDSESLYLVEFKSIPGWLAPSPVVLKKGETGAVVEGVYTPMEYVEQTILTLGGASTMANRLAPELAQFYLTHIGANEIRKLPGKNTDELTVQGIFYATKEIRTIHIQGQGTPGGLAALRDNSCDVAMIAGDIAPGRLDSLVGYKVAMDAVAVVVHQANPVPALTVAEVGKIFNGEITNWNEVGGPTAPIKVFALKDTYGTRNFFDAVFLRGKALTEYAREIDIHSQLPELVTQDPWAIGYCSIALANQCREMPLKVSSDADPVLPSPQAIRAMHYPAYRNLYLYSRSDSKNVFAQDFISVSRSPAGQAIVRKFGFVGGAEDINQDDSQGPVLISPQEESAADVQNGLPLKMDDGGNETASADSHEASEAEEELPFIFQYENEVVSTDLRSRVLQEYRSATQGAEKLPMVFNFEGASYALRPEAVKDVALLAQMMREETHAGKQIILVGFSDSMGAYEANLDISKKRAEAVAQALALQGVKDVRIVSAGEEEAVESNESRAGRERNRRVETWMK